jgi:endonuclease YncB( thermonuclease family)
MWLVAISANASGCRFEARGEGRVDVIIDSRSIRFTDGHEVLLDGIEPINSNMANAAKSLATILAGRDVTLHGDSDTPDGYGRQPAFVYLNQKQTSAQQRLLAQGDAVVSAAIAVPDCAAELLAAEAEARTARRGIWSDPTFIKRAEKAENILAMVGRFALVEGRILSVREAGATLYLNFGRAGHRTLL